MKIESNTIEQTPRKNFTTLKASPPALKKSHPSSFIPLIHMSRTYCMIDRLPPVKSRRMLMIDHPLVDLRFQFRYTCGQYLKNEIAALQYPAILKKL